MIIKSLEQLNFFSKKVANHLNEKDCIFLIGEIGVGKTTFTRFLINYLQKKEDSKIRIVRGAVEDPKEETEIVNRINEKMFELELPKIQFEKVYSDSNIITELLKNFKKEKHALLVLGAGNQTETAFSPKTLSILDKTGKSAIIVRNHRFSEVHARSFANFILPRIIQVKFVYQIYVNLMQKIYSMRAKSRRERNDDDYFNA